MDASKLRKIAESEENNLEKEFVYENFILPKLVAEAERGGVSYTFANRDKIENLDLEEPLKFVAHNLAEYLNKYMLRFLRSKNFTWKYSRDFSSDSEKFTIYW